MSLNLEGSVEAVTLENKALLSAFFIVIAAIIARIFTVYDASLLLEQKLNNPTKAHVRHFAQVGSYGLADGDTIADYRTLPAFN